MSARVLTNAQVVSATRDPDAESRRSRDRRVEAVARRGDVHARRVLEATRCIFTASASSVCYGVEKGERIRRDSNPRGTR